MVVHISVNGGPPGPTGEFQRPGMVPRFVPGYGTHGIIPNRNAQVTVEVGPPVYPIDSVHNIRMAEHLIGAGNPGGELILGTNVVVQPRANDEWIRKYDSGEYGRNSEDLYANTSVPMWMPRAQPSPVEDRA